MRGDVQLVEAVEIGLQFVGEVGMRGEELVAIRRGTPFEVGEILLENLRQLAARRGRLGERFVELVDGVVHDRTNSVFTTEAQRSQRRDANSKLFPLCSLCLCG